MKLKEICEQIGIDYDPNHSKQVIDKIKKEYIIERNMLKKRDYVLVRKLTDEEKAEIHQISMFKPILKDTIYLYLEMVENNTIRGDANQFLEKFEVVNPYFRLFLYDRPTAIKTELINSISNDNDDDLQKSKNADELTYFAKSYNPILKRALKDCFREMVDEQLIYKTEIPMYVKEEKVISENGETYLISSKNEMTQEMIEKRMELRRLEWQKLNKGYTAWSQLNYYQQKSIDSNVAKQMGVKFFYPDYKLVINKQGVKDVIRSTDNLKKMKEQLNSETIKKIMSSKANGTEIITYREKINGINALIKQI